MNRPVSTLFGRYVCNPLKVLANDGIHPVGKTLLEQHGFQVLSERIAQRHLIEFINQEQLTGIIVRSRTEIRKHLIDSCPHLRFIGRGGNGIDNIDVEYAKQKGLTVITTPSASAQSVAELVMTHLFNMTRLVYQSNRRMPREGATEFHVLKRQYEQGRELRGKTLGIVGFGRIGQATAAYALGCGMKILAHDMHIQKASIPIEIEGAPSVEIPIQTTSLEDVLSRSEFITIHVPRQDRDRHVIGRAEIRQMKPGVCLMNLARGGLLDEEALIEALRTGQVAHAALDVFENEPAPRQALLQHPRISLTPHIGAGTIEAQERIGVELANQIIQYVMTIRRERPQDWRPRTVFLAS